MCESRERGNDSRRDRGRLGLVGCEKRVDRELGGDMSVVGEQMKPSEVLLLLRGTEGEAGA